MGMKKLLSLDLGITTGYAVIWGIQDGGDLDEHGFLSGPFMLRDFSDWLAMLAPTHVVVESPVIFRGALGDDLQEIVEGVKTALKEIETTYVTPADWKGTKYKKLAVKRGVTQHERDAIRMGYWFLETHLKST